MALWRSSHASSCAFPRFATLPLDDGRRYDVARRQTAIYGNAGDRYAPAPVSAWAISSLGESGMSPVRCLLAFLTLGVGVCLADDFRIQNRVYLGKSKAPASTTVTLFRGGLVYDILANPEEIVVFDPVRGRFVLLKPARSIRTEISTEEIDRLVLSLKEELANRGGGLSDFLIAPEYEIDDAKPSQVKFRGSFAEYQLKTEKAASLIAARQFAQFSNWYTRFNTMTNPALLARMPVNAWLAQNERIPSEIELTMYNKTLGISRKQQSLRSEHAITWFLSQDDLKQIEQIDRWLVTFTAVPFDEYRRTPAFKAD